jgi:hypothetical protein
MVKAGGEARDHTEKAWFLGLDSRYDKPWSPTAVDFEDRWVCRLTLRASRQTQRRLKAFGVRL